MHCALHGLGALTEMLQGLRGAFQGACSAARAPRKGHMRRRSEGTTDPWKEMAPMYRPGASRSPTLCGSLSFQYGRSSLSCHSLLGRKLLSDVSRDGRYVPHLPERKGTLLGNPCQMGLPWMLLCRNDSSPAPSQSQLLPPASTRIRLGSRSSLMTTTTLSLTVP